MEIQIQLADYQQEGARVRGRIELRTDFADVLRSIAVRCVLEPAQGKSQYWGIWRRELNLESNADTGWLIPFDLAMKAPENSDMPLGEDRLSTEEQANRLAWRQELQKLAGDFFLDITVETAQAFNQLHQPVQLV